MMKYPFLYRSEPLFVGIQNFLKLGGNFNHLNNGKILNILNQKIPLVNLFVKYLELFRIF